MSRKRRKDVRRKSSGLLAAAILFVFVFEHFFVPFSYATSPDMASASDAIQSGKVTLTNVPEEDVQIAVLSDEAASASGYSAGQTVCLDVYIKNNTADTITDGFLKYAGTGIEKDRESTYFELIEGAVGDAGLEDAEEKEIEETDGESLSGNGLSGAVRSGDEADEDTEDRELDGEDQDLEKPDVLKELVLAPGQSCHVGFYYTIKEDLRGTKDQNIRFTFGWEEDGKARTSEQTFRYVVGAMNLLPVEILGGEQALGGGTQIYAGEAGEMLLDFELGQVWEIIDERLEETFDKEEETVVEGGDAKKDEAADGIQGDGGQDDGTVEDGAAEKDGDTGEAEKDGTTREDEDTEEDEDAGKDESVGGSGSGQEDADAVGDGSGEDSDRADGSQGGESGADMSQGDEDGADGSQGGESGADVSQGDVGRDDMSQKGESQKAGAPDADDAGRGEGTGTGDTSRDAADDGAGEQGPALQMGEPRDIPLVREPLDAEMEAGTPAADGGSGAPEGMDAGEERDDAAVQEPQAPAQPQPDQAPAPQQPGTEDNGEAAGAAGTTEPAGTDDEQTTMPPATDDVQGSTPPMTDSGQVPVPPAVDEGQTEAPPAADGEQAVTPPATDGDQTILPPAAGGEQVVPPATDGDQTILPPAADVDQGTDQLIPPAADGGDAAAPTATSSTAAPKPDDGLGDLIKWEDDAISGGEKPVIKGIRCDVEAYGIKLDAFKVAEGEDGEEDGQSTSVRCTFRVDGKAEPGTYYGNVKASYQFKGRTFHTTQGFIIVVPEIEDGAVAEVIRLIDALPEQTEVEEAFAAYDLAEDEEGRDAYYMELYAQVMEAYRKYMALSSEQQEKVYNRDKLMAYEWLWGGAMLAAGDVLSIWNYPQLIEELQKGSSVKLGQDITGSYSSGQIVINGVDAVLDLNGKTLTYTGNENDLFKITSGSLTIIDSTGDGTDGTILGITVGNVANVGASGSLHIKGGTITTKQSERAVFSSGTVIMEGGAISENHNGKTMRAGGIFANGGTLKILGGSIDHNSAPYGGGIYTRNNAQVIIEGGEICDNKATDGGGICSFQLSDEEKGNAGSTIHISGGTIARNSAVGNGGGIYARLGTSKVIIDGGSITNNEAKTGGGVAVEAWCPIDLSGGNIEKNKAEGSGGGIAVTDGILTVTGGRIEENVSQGDGGGIAVIANGTINLKGGSIKKNTAQGNGGGIAFAGKGNAFRGLFMQDGDGEITENMAAKDGGGVAVTGDTYQVVIDKGTIAKNKAGDPKHKIQNASDDPHLDDGKDDICGNGGGIYIAPKSEVGNRTPLTINGGTIVENESYAVTRDATDTPNSVGGGGIFTGSDLTITGGEIRDNYAAEGGGGILFYYRCPTGWDPLMPNSGGTRPTFKMSGSTISGNVAVKSEGGGLYFQGDGEISGGQFINNETRTIYDYGGGGIFIMTNATLQLYNALITDNFAEAYGGGLAGCAKSNTYIFSVKGGAIYQNTARGDHEHLTLSKAGDEKVLRVEDFRQKSNGSIDYFCSGKSVVYDHMLGGGHSRWSGFCDGETMAVPLNGFVKTKEDSDFADGRDGKGLMGLTAYPTSDDIAKVDRIEDKVIFTGNKSNTHGGGISNNGVLYLGEGTGTDWEPAAKKTYHANGQAIDLTKDQFTFVMLDKVPEKDPQTGKLKYEEESVVSTATNDDKGEIRFRVMADRAFSPDDFTSGAGEDAPQEGVTHDYTFYMMEKADANGNIRYDTTVYKIDVTMVMHVQEEEDVQDNIVSYVKIYTYMVAKDSAGKDRIKVSVLGSNGSEAIEGDEIKFANFWIETPSGGGGGGGHTPTPDPPEEPPKPVTPENPPIIPSDDTGNGTVVEIVEEKIEVPIFALPDAALPQMPEEITLFENGVPRGYRRVWNPDTQQWEWIPEDEVPLTTVGLAKAGDDSHPMLWLALFAASAIGIVALVILRRKSGQGQKDMEMEE